MLERHLHIAHELVCVTRDSAGIDPRVRIVKPPIDNSPRCRRRMWQFGKERVAEFGSRMLCLDLDVVIVDNITPLAIRAEPIVMWKVGYAGVFSGSFHLSDTGALDGAWQAYRASPEGFPASCKEQNASDQAMLNTWLKRTSTPVAQWTERDGIYTWFGGERYKPFQNLGMGPDQPNLPQGARVIVLGSSDKGVMDEGRYPFVVEHWR